MSRSRARWVVKAGSQLVCEGGPLLLKHWAQQIAELRARHGIEVVWVTSGAIASARESLKRKRGKESLAEKQALSAIGQPLVMDLYSLALQAVHVRGAQVLLTYDDLANRKRRENFQQTVETLLKWQVVPVLNENDAVATEEIKFGDNDMLSARVACTVRADRLIILTDVEGLYTADPRKNPEATLVRELRSVPASLVESVSRASTSDRGTGGMGSKLAAAAHAMKSGVRTHLIKGDAHGALLKIAHGESLGTTVLSRKQ